MGFTCSLEIFYPGAPPVVTVGSLRAFSEAIALCGFTESPRVEAVKLAFGDAARAYAKIAAVEGDQFEAMESFYDTPFHHAAHGRGGNLDLWPDEEHAARSLLRASVDLGELLLRDPDELTCQDVQAPSCWFALHSLSLEVYPDCPIALGMEDEAFVCLGFFELSLSGMGYFSWGELTEQTRVVGASPAVKTFLDCCRARFPVPSEPTRLQRVEEVLGDRFLNRATYQPGDWVVSYSEEG